MTHLGSFPHTFEDGPGNTASGEEVMDNLGFLKDGVDAVDDRVGTLESSGPADGTVDTGALAAGAVTSAKIADGTIATGDLADGAVTSAKIADGTIASADLTASLAGTAAPTLVSSLPGSPTDGQEVYYYPSVGILWHLKYMGYLGAGWTTYGNWYCIGAIPLIASDTGLVALASVSYADPSPAMTLSLPMKGMYEVRIEADIVPPATSHATSWISFKTSATAASDSNGANLQDASGSGSLPVGSQSKTSVIAVTAARTLTEQLRATSGTCAVMNRRLIVRPLAIG